MSKTLSKEIIAAMLRDYLDDHPLDAIASRYNVGKETVHRHVRQAELPRRRRIGGLAPRPCEHCGEPCRTVRGVCATCTDLYDDHDRDDVELTGGRWVRQGLVRVWEPTQPDLIVGRRSTLAESAGDILAEVQRRAAVGSMRRAKSDAA